jgi:hypothetical protein
VLLTMYDARLNLSRQVVADAREHFGQQVFQTVIPRNVRLAEAPSFGKPILLYDVTSVGRRPTWPCATSSSSERAALGVAEPAARGGEPLMARPDKPRRLGRGLEALLASRQAAEPTPEEQSALRPSPSGRSAPTRTSRAASSAPEELADLEASLKASGLLQPVTVARARRAATSSSPASAGCARRSGSGGPRSRRWSRPWTTRRCSRWRSSRTCSART